MSLFLSVWMELADILLAEAALRFEDIEAIGTVSSFEVLLDKVVGGLQPDFRFSIFITLSQFHQLDHFSEGKN